MDVLAAKCSQVNLCKIMEEEDELWLAETIKFCDDFCLELLISRGVVSLSSIRDFNLETQWKALHMPPRALLSSGSLFFLGISFPSMLLTS